MNTRTFWVGLLITIGALVPVAASAMTVESGKQAVVAQGTTVADDQYLAGGSITAAGTFSRDLVIAGGTISVSGPVGAELLVAGGNVTVTGSVGGTARIAGGNVTVEGAIAHDLAAAGGTVTVGGPGINGDVMIAGGGVTITAPIHGNLRIYGSAVTIDSAIGGNVSIHAKSVTLGAHAKIGGTLTYVAPAPATIADGATVLGATTYTPAAGKAGHKGMLAIGLAVLSVILLVKTLMILVGSLAVGYFFKTFSHTMVARAAARPWAEMWRGLVVMIVLPAVSVLLFITVIGIPLGVLGFFAYGLVMVFISLATPIVTGALIHKRIWKSADYVVDWRTVLLGTLICLILKLIPVVGWIVLLGLTLMTLGAAATIKWDALKEWR